MKIYVASSWRNSYQPEVVDLLRKLGHEVYDFRNPPHGNTGFAWSDIDEYWLNWTTEQYREALNHPIAEAGFNSDFDGMKWADCCVMVLPCGRSANTEAGWMKGNGKSVYIFSPVEQEPELMYKLYDGIISTFVELQEKFSVGEIARPQEPAEGHPMLFEHLKHFCNSLDVDQLRKNVVSVGEEQGDYIISAGLQEYDLWVNRNDSDDCGSLPDLKDMHGDEFNQEDYKLAVPIGTPRLYHF